MFWSEIETHWTQCVQRYNYIQYFHVKKIIKIIENNKTAAAQDNSLLFNS